MSGAVFPVRDRLRRDRGGRVVPARYSLAMDLREGGNGDGHPRGRRTDLVRRWLPTAILLAVVVLLLHSFGWPWQWVDLHFGSSVDRVPATPVALAELPQYARDVSGAAWFHTYFLRMAFSEADGGRAYTGTLTRWTKRRVTIRIVNSGGPGLDTYVRSLAAQLDAMQSATDFVVVDGASDITIEYLSHEEYRRAVRGGDTVGDCATRYFQGPQGIFSAAIKVDAGVLTTPDDRKATVIHEITHALGFEGHFRDPSDQRVSVLYYASTLTAWSQQDAAAIRILYSSDMQSGMTVPQANAALTRYAHGRE